MINTGSAESAADLVPEQAGKHADRSGKSRGGKDFGWSEMNSRRVNLYPLVYLGRVIIKAWSLVTVSELDATACRMNFLNAAEYTNVCRTPHFFLLVHGPAKDC
jgi:hypothetical protein